MKPFSFEHSSKNHGDIKLRGYEKKRTGADFFSPQKHERRETFCPVFRRVVKYTDGLSVDSLQKMSRRLSWYLHQRYLLLRISVSELR